MYVYIMYIYKDTHYMINLLDAMHHAAASPAPITMAGLTGRQWLVFQVCRPCQASALTR